MKRSCQSCQDLRVEGSECMAMGQNRHEALEDKKGGPCG